MKQSISFTLNGRPVTMAVSGDEPVLTVLRTYLDLTGTKNGCGLGECGACTILVDKEAVRSCMISAEDLEGKEILTIEGLSANGNLHPLQKAFMEHDALQCGFCTPGMIMNAYGLLLQKPRASRAEIITAMDANLCRCGAYNRIADAIESLSNK
jgi:aerobic-type carbon monoxide dehydrogenase small subunit (CoxS/CutS family)